MYFFVDASIGNEYVCLELNIQKKEEEGKLYMEAFFGIESLYLEEKC